MNKLAVLPVWIVLLTGIEARAPAQAPGKPALPEKPAPSAQQHPNAQAWLRILVMQMSNPDPRIRLSVREALHVMGPRSLDAVNEGKAKQKNPHVKAFMTRTLTYLKIKRGGKQGKRTPFWDIDHVAAVANLKWEQIDKTLPVLVAAHKQNRELTTAFKEAGGDFRDPEAMQDLGEEIKAGAAEAEEKLKKFLQPKQVELLRRYFDPWRQWQARHKARRESVRKEDGQ